MSLHKIYDRIENARIKFVKTVCVIGIPVILIFGVVFLSYMYKPDFSNPVVRGIVSTLNK